MAQLSGAARYHLTPEERAQFHMALFARLLQEVKGGSLKDAQLALDMIEGGKASGTLEALLGDYGVSDEA